MGTTPCLLTACVYPNFPVALAGKLPRYPLLPATLLGRLAVSGRHQGMKPGRFLLINALERSWKNSTEVASVGVVAEAMNDDARAFYLHHGFIPLTGNANRLFLPMKTIAKLFASQ